MMVVNGEEVKGVEVVGVCELCEGVLRGVEVWRDVEGAHDAPCVWGVIGVEALCPGARGDAQGVGPSGEVMFDVGEYGEQLILGGDGVEQLAHGEPAACAWRVMEEAARSTEAMLSGAEHGEERV